MKKFSLFFKDAKPGAQLLGLVFYLLLGFIIAMGLQVLIPIEGDTPGAIRGGMWLQALSQLLMFFFPALFFVMVYHGSPSQYLHLDFHGRKWFLSFVAVIIFVLLLPINDWLTAWNDQWNLGSYEDSARHITELSKMVVDRMFSLTQPADLLLQLLVIALIPAVCEELFFRGALQQILRQWFGNGYVAIAVTALIFSLVHGDVYGLVPRFVLGLLLGYLYFSAESLLVNVCVHFFNNACVVVAFYAYHHGSWPYNPYMPLFFPWNTILLFTLAAVALFAVYFVKFGRKSTDEKHA